MRVMVHGGTAQQLQALREAIEGLDLPVHADAIAEARELLDALGARLAEAEADYVRTHQEVVDGYPDAAAFFRHRCRLTVPDSRMLAKQSRRLAAWPQLGQAWRAGVVTGAQVSLACRLVPDRHVERFAETLDDTIALLAPLTAHQTSRVLSRWVDHADDAAQREAAEEAQVEPSTEPERDLSAARSLGDELVLRGFVDPDSAVFVEHALLAATRPDADGEQRTPGQRRADALVDICRAYLDHLEGPDGSRRRERVMLVADVHALHRAVLVGLGIRTADDLSDFLADHSDMGPLERGLFLEAFDGEGGAVTTVNGRPVTDALLAAATDGGLMELLLTSGEQPLQLGRSVRLFTEAQRRALLALWQGCACCHAPVDRVDIHHVSAWDAGGRTDVGNGVPKCRRCHLEHHRLGWPDRLEPDGTYALTLPDGTERRYRPPGQVPELPVLPVATTAHRARPFVRERAPVHEWSPYDEPAVAAVIRELVIARLKKGDDHADTLELRARFDDAYDRAEPAVA